jgi:hypothetical protein
LYREQLGMLDAVKTMHIQPFMSDRSIEALDVGILGRLAGLDIQQRDLLLICPADLNGYFSMQKVSRTGLVSLVF